MYKRLLECKTDTTHYTEILVKPIWQKHSKAATNKINVILCTFCIELLNRPYEVFAQSFSTSDSNFFENQNENV